MLLRTLCLLLPILGLLDSAAVNMNDLPAGDPPPVEFQKELIPEGWAARTLRRLRRSPLEGDGWRQYAKSLGPETRSPQFITARIEKIQPPRFYGYNSRKAVYDATDLDYRPRYDSSLSSANDNPRRVIYYDNLDRSGNAAPDYRRYPSDLAGSGASYPRDERYDTVRSQNIAVRDKDAYLPSYTIIDADRQANNYPRNPPVDTYYDRYRQPAYNQQSDRYRAAPADKYRAPADRYYPEDRNRYYPAGDKYYPNSNRDRYDNSIVPRSRDPLRQDDGRNNLLGDAIAADPELVDPYRSYNPRQPAPWSVQVGTSLTVKDDGRHTGRRFYVQSQREPSRNPETTNLSRGTYDNRNYRDRQ